MCSGSLIPVMPFGILSAPADDIRRIIIQPSAWCQLSTNKSVALHIYIIVFFHVFACSLLLRCTLKSTTLRVGVKTRGRPISVFWGRYRYIGHSWADGRYWQPIFLKFLNHVFCFIVKNLMHAMPYLFFKASKIIIFMS